MNTALELSKYIISRCYTDGYPVSNLQIQRMLYLIQKSFLKQNMIAFPDDIEAWQFGPVVPNVYYRFCGWGAMPISLMMKNRYSVNIHEHLVIEDIIKTVRCQKPWDSVKEILKPDGAWAKTYRDGLGDHCVISRKLIKAEGWL